MDPEPDEEAAALVGDLVQAARVPAKRRPFVVKPTVERLTSLAYDHGLPLDTLRDLVDVVTMPGHLDQASLGALVRNLYPAAPAVPDDVVLAVVGCLGQGQLKASLAVQALLLRWLVLAYHVLSSSAVLSRAYGVLFSLLDTVAIRPQLCHVLALITRRRHVRPFRIQAILNLSRQAGHDPHLVGLLRVFKNYYPEVIVGEATRGRASPFKHPDPQWRARLDEIQLARRQNLLLQGGGSNGAGTLDVQSGFRVRQDHQLGRRSANGGFGISGIPAVHTLHAQVESVTLEEIDSAEGLVQNLEKIELPSQLVAVLADPLLQKLLQLRPAAEATARVDNWLAACVASAASGDSSPDELMDLVEAVHYYVTGMQTFPPVLHPFFRQLLSAWDHQTKKELILETLSFVPVQDFSETYESTFALLEKTLLDGSPESHIDLLAFYTKLLHNWRVTLAATKGATAALSKDGNAAALPNFISHVAKLVLVVLQTSPAASSSSSVSTGAALAALDFYEEVTATLGLGRDDVLEQVQAVVPPPTMVYTLHFSQSATVASRLYAILAAYKRALEAAMARRPGRQLAAAERARVNLFNGFLMDVCNCLWRLRAFSASDTNAQGCRVPLALVPRLAHYVQSVDRDLSLTAAFSLSQSPTLCLQAIGYLRALEDAAIGPDDSDSGSGSATAATVRRRHAGPVTQAALLQLARTGGINVSWAAYRSGLLDYLENRGYGGVSALMHNTMKNLMNARTG